MRPPSRVHITLALIAACVSISVWRYTELVAANEAAGNAAQSLSRTATNGRELLTLRTEQREIDPVGPRSDAYIRVVGTMEAAALDADTLTASVAHNVSRGSQSVVITLNPMPVTDLGLWLNIWHRDNAAWAIERVELRADRRQPGKYAATVRVRVPDSPQAKPQQLGPERPEASEM